MTPEQAAWVYEQVILGYHDANEANWWCGPDQSDDRLICACQLPCTWCRDGRHDICAGAKERRQAMVRQAAVRTEDGEKTSAVRQWRVGWGPETCLHAPGRWRPPTRKRPLWLPVFLADRVCHFLCTCTACTPPVKPPASPAPKPLTLANSVQLDLFAGVA